MQGGVEKPRRTIGQEFGDVAQLGERCPCKAEVVGSIPIVSSTEEEKIKISSTGGLTGALKPGKVPRSQKTTLRGTEFCE